MFKFQGFTEKANKALNLAVESAQQFGHSYVGTEHVLLGLLKEGTGVACTALSACGVTAEVIEEKIRSSAYGGAPTSLTANDFTPRTTAALPQALPPTILPRVQSAFCARL